MDISLISLIFDSFRPSAADFSWIFGTRTPILSDLPADGWVKHQGRRAEKGYLHYFPIH